MLFEPFRIDNLDIRNRFFRSATCEGMADENGAVTDKQVAFFRELSAGRIGLIVTGHMYVHPSGVASPGMTGIDSDASVEGLRRIAETIRSGGARGVVQINHGGGNARVLVEKGEEVAAPSALRHGKGPLPRALTSAEVRELIVAFAAAARRVKEAGFDGVQIHAAHGYLISQFLSPLTNQRDDEYGGSFENRCRFLRRVIEESRRAVGDGFPLLVKLGSYDGGEGGMTLEEGAAVGVMLEDLGTDALELSGGVGANSTRMRIRRPEQEAYFRDEVALFRKKLSIPLIMVGGLRSRDVMERVLAEGIADMVSLCRPFIREPGLAKKFRSGESEKALCVSCNRCFKTMGRDFGCAHGKGRERD
jgi:2,4-dienoyl-CoA reductase-like NADH-dependent reductase (Old Yellow Enzyme family)